MRYLLALLILLAGESVTQAQDWNVQCTTSTNRSLYFVGNGSYGAALFYGPDYAVAEEYTDVTSRQFITIYQGVSSYLVIFEGRDGIARVLAAPQSHGWYVCDPK